MSPNLSPSFDSISTGSLPGGDVMTLDNGTVAFIPKTPLAFGLNSTVALEMLNLSLIFRGFAWGGFSYGGNCRMGFLQKLGRPELRQITQTVDTSSGAKRMARSALQLLALAEVREAFAYGDLRTLLTHEALAFDAKQRVKADRKAARVVKEALQYQHYNWPKAEFGLYVQEQDNSLILQFNYDASVVKAAKAKRAIFNGYRKSWTLSKANETAFGKRLWKIAQTLGKVSKDEGVSECSFTNETPEQFHQIDEEEQRPNDVLLE